MKIRDFIYIDEYKLQSFYSQINEGLIQSVTEIKKSQKETIDSTSKKEKASFLNLSDEKTAAVNTKTASNSSENKIYHDHLYNDFEKRLGKEIYDINEQKNISSDSIIPSLKDAFLVKICSDARIEDYNDLLNFIDKYNNLIKKFNIVNSYSKDKNKSVIKIEKHEEIGKQYMDAMKDLIKTFFKNNIQIIFNNHQSNQINLRCILESKYLRVNQEFINTLYRGKRAPNWTMVGQITYVPSINLDEKDFDINPNPNNMSDALETIFGALKNMYKVSGNPTDIIVSPIAIYREKEINIEIKKSDKS